MSRFKVATIRGVTDTLLVLVLVLGVGGAALFAQHALAPHSSNTAATQKTWAVKGGSTQAGVRSGQVSTATLPIATNHSQATSTQTTPTDRPLKSSSQLASYQQYALTHPSTLPHATAAPAPSLLKPNLYRYGNIPVLERTAPGLNFSQSGGWIPPDQAVAQGSNLLFEGVNNVMEVYDAFFSPKYGPWTPDTFFAAVMHSGDTFSDPQITFDAEFKVFLLSWLEISPTGKDYIDLAISKTLTPSPLSNFYVYQVDPTTISGGSDDFCDYDTLGYDYNAIYVTCVTFSISTGNFLGNNTFAFSRTNMMSGNLGTWDYWYSINTDVGAAYRLSPAIEDGIPEAEWIAATDAGYGVTSSNLTLCSITNTQAVGTSTLPTLTCANTSLPLAYDDPIGAAQPGTSSTIYPGVAFKQFSYINGKLYFALPMALTCSGNVHDGLLWADVYPQLTTRATHNPQWVNGTYTNFNEAAYYCYSSADIYMPTLIASSENDLTLVYNYSSSSVYPSIVFTGRGNADAPGTMGEGVSSQFVIQGTTGNTSGRWGDYSACALNLHSASRGYIYCGGEYGGSDFWNTEIYSIKMD